MKICIIIIMLSSFSIYCMKRPAGPDGGNPLKKSGKKVELLNLSSEHKREIIFDSFMIVEQFEEIVPQVERDKLRDNFVLRGIVEGDNKTESLLQQYYNIIMSGGTPQKRIVNGEIFFEEKK